MTSKETINARKAEFIINALENRNMNGFYCPTKEEAVKLICSMVPSGSLVGLGGSMTIVDSGLVDALRELDIKLLDRYRKGVSDMETDKMRKEGMLADILIASSNAITADGELVNEDGLGNRVAGMVFGPDKVILMVGMNKVVTNVDAGIDRIKNHVAPINCIRLNRETPCAETGFCDDHHCDPPARICSQMVIIESNAVKDRMNIVLVGEDLGY